MTSSTTQPDFRFDNTHHHIRVTGDEAFTSVEDAESWLHGTTTENPVVAGLIPYEYRTGRCSLFGGSRSDLHDEPSQTGRRPPNRFRYDVAFNTAESERYLSSLETALNTLNGPSSQLRKIVLSRVERYQFDGEFPVGDYYSVLRSSHPRGNNFCVRDLHGKARFHLGSSPELFLRKVGDRIQLHPLAGTLRKDPQLPSKDDRKRVENQFQDQKFRDEHSYLVDFLHEALAPLCSSLTVPSEPELVAAPNVWHLGTPVEGTVQSTATDLTDLLRVLHPSPAVCGVPRDTANDLIAEQEGRRGYYAGLIGWFDRHGDCELYLALRSMAVDLASHHVDLRGGGGVVGSSSIPAEFSEIDTKMTTMQQVLGIPGSATEPRHSLAG